MQTILIFTQFDFQSILKTTQQDPHASLDEFTTNYLLTIGNPDNSEIREPTYVGKADSLDGAYARSNRMLSNGEVAVIINEKETHLIYKSERQEQPKQETRLDELQPEHVHTMFEIGLIVDENAANEIRKHVLLTIPPEHAVERAYVEGWLESARDKKLENFYQITEVNDEGEQFGSWTGEEFLRVVDNNV